MASALNDDTQQSIAEGRETAKAFLRSIQKDLQKVFVVFLFGFILTFWALRVYIWDWLRQVTESNMSPEVAAEADIIATTPFEVILLQAKIGLIVGVIAAIPPLIYVARDELRARGMWPRSPVARWKLAGIALLGAGLFSAGVAYGVFAFFPLMFGFLAEFGLEANIQPTYGIVMWTEFIVFLSLSFGLAGQMPLLVTGLSYAEIVQYETFRDKWRYAVLAIFVFGAFFSPPDPFTQLLWAFPLTVLYGFSLYLAKLVVTAKRSSDRIDVPGAVRDHWNVVGGVTLLGGALAYGFYEYGGRAAVNAVLRHPLVDSSWRFLEPGAGLGVDPATALGIYAGAWALAFAVIATLWAVYTDLDTASAGRQYGDPTAIDVSELDAAGVRAAPADAFAEMEESEPLALAQAAVEDDEPEKAQAILDRFDEVNEGDEDGDGDTAAGGDGDTAADEDASAGGDGSGGDDGLMGSVRDRGSRAGSTFLAEFTDGDGEEAEDDIGGYYTDLKFIFDSLRSGSFRIVAVFGAVMAAAFMWLYLGGLGTVRGDLERRVPAEVEGGINIITLHPVEALVFMVKFSVVIGIFAAFPLVLYYAWPALRERGFVAGRVYQVYLWAGALGVGMVGGFALGYAYIAPGLIGWLVTDARLADMIITYQVSDFLWLVIYTTIGIGFLVDIPIVMVLMNNAGVPYRVFRERWREATIATMLIATVFTPSDVVTMFLATVPLMAAYGVGVATLFLVTFGGRRNLSPPAEFVGR